MKKKILMIIITFMLIISGPLFYGVYWVFFDMSRLPKGNLISEIKSPNGDYTIKAYVSDGGATTDFAVLGELNFNIRNKKPKNIYWNYHENTANIRWVDEDTVIINGHELDVPNDTFDFRSSK